MLLSINERAKRGLRGPMATAIQPNASALIFVAPCVSIPSMTRRASSGRVVARL